MLMNAFANVSGERKLGSVIFFFPFSHCLPPVPLGVRAGKFDAEMRAHRQLCASAIAREAHTEMELRICTDSAATMPTCSERDSNRDAHQTSDLVESAVLAASSVTSVTRAAT